LNKASREACFFHAQKEESKVNVQKIAIEKLKAAEYNPRIALKAGDKEYEKLKRSIQEFGFVEPIVWNSKTGNVVGGHQRLTVLKDLGECEIDCVVVDLDGQKEKESYISRRARRSLLPS
jgi:ParB-like chromosome segregation protein Spo0J